jgi:hypothetical protein
MRRRGGGRGEKGNRYQKKSENFVQYVSQKKLKTIAFFRGEWYNIKVYVYIHVQLFVKFLREGFLCKRIRGGFQEER